MDIIKKIKEIVEDHLTNTEINDVALCEDTHDHYLLGKWDLAQEINEVLIKQELREPNDITGDLWK